MNLHLGELVYFRSKIESFCQKQIQQKVGLPSHFVDVRVLLPAYNRVSVVHLPLRWRPLS